MVNTVRIRLIQEFWFKTQFLHVRKHTIVEKALRNIVISNQIWIVIQFSDRFHKSTGKG